MGTYNSLKGFGICMNANTESGIRNSYTLYADTFDVLNGKYNTPGIKAVFLHYNRLAGFSTEKARIDLLLAPGATVGYVRDYNSGGHYGICSCVDFSTCCLASFDRGIEIEFGFDIELGVLGRRLGDGIELGLYRNGVSRGYFPHVKISYRFR